MSFAVTYCDYENNDFLAIRMAVQSYKRRKLTAFWFLSSLPHPERLRYCPHCPKRYDALSAKKEVVEACSYPVFLIQCSDQQCFEIYFTSCPCCAAYTRELLLYLRLSISKLFGWVKNTTKCWRNAVLFQILLLNIYFWYWYPCVSVCSTDRVSA
jgi:hypothetical protein